MISENEEFCIEKGILKKYIGDKTHIVIPDCVTSIGYNAFKDCKTLKYITFSDGVTNIEGWAFNNCTNLEKVVFSDNITSIGYGAFCGCENLRNIKLPSNIKCLEGEVFANCKSLVDINLPQSFTAIESEAFARCESLKSISIPHSVTSIGRQAFCKCTSLSNINISSNVNFIGENAFYKCDNLKSINVDDNNLTFASVDGILYDKALKTIVFIPIGIEGPVTIPPSITSIEGWAFSNCKKLKGINLPDTMISLGFGSFAHCDSLSSIIIPKTITYIRDWVFGHCNNLNSIIFKGEIENIDNEAFNGCHNITSIVFENKQIMIKKSWFNNRTRLMKAISGNVYPSQLSSQYKKELLSDVIKHLQDKDYKDSKWSDLWFAYLKSKRKSLYVDILKNEDLLQFMIEQKFLDLADVKDLIVMASKKSLVNISLVLLDYQNKTFSEEEVLDYTINELCNNSSSVSYLKKIWSFTKKEDGTLVITKYKGSDLNIIVPDKIGEDKVTAIGKGAFSPVKCHKISDEQKEIRRKIISVIIPDTVDTIEEDAFWGCESLSTIIIPNSVTSIDWGAFANCTSLNIITLPYNIVSIGWGTFEGCISLKNIDIPQSVTTIGEDAFLGCENLSSINLPDTITSIGYGAFARCNSLANIRLPSSITSISKQVFYKCESLKSIVIPQNVTSIETEAFADCKNLDNIKIEGSVNSIGGGAFSGCDSLEIVETGNISASIKAFEVCNSTIKEFILPNKISNRKAFKSIFTQFLNLRTVTLPEGIKDIPDNAFYNYKNMEFLYIPSTVNTIGQSILKNCDNLKSIKISVDNENYYVKDNSIYDKEHNISLN